MTIKTFTRSAVKKVYENTKPPSAVKTFVDTLPCLLSWGVIQFTSKRGSSQSAAAGYSASNRSEYLANSVV